MGDALSDRTRISVVAANRVRRSLLQLGVAEDADEQARARAIRDLFGVDHVLFARLDGQGTDLRLHYRLIDANGLVQVGDVAGAGVGSLARAAAERVSGALDVAYAAGIPIRRIAADEFVNEAFARGMQSLVGGDARAAASLFESAIATAPDSGWINYELGNARLQLGELSAATDAFNAALELARLREDRNLAGAAQTGLGQIAWRGGDLAGATQLFGAARVEFVAVGNRANLASAIGNLGILADNRGDLDMARALYEEALALFRQEHERAGESAVYSNLAVLARKRGELLRAADLQGRALGLQQKSGLRQMALFSANHLGEIQRLLGRWELAAEQIAQAQAEATELEDPLALGDAALARAWLDFDQGETLQARRGAQQALERFATRKNPAGELRALLLLLHIDASESQVDSATFERAREIATRLGDDSTQLELIALDPHTSSEALATAISQAQTRPEAPAHALLLWSAARRNPDAGRWQAAFDLASNAADPRLQALIALDFARWVLASGSAQGIDALLGRADAWRPDHPQSLELQACRLQRQGSLLPAQQKLAAADGAPGRRTDLSQWCPELLQPASD
jgi:tetratricopeptide (TPR) repeat protein